MCADAAARDGGGAGTGAGAGAGPDEGDKAPMNAGDIGRAAAAASAAQVAAAPTCRWCFEESERFVKDGRLITPCACTGTQAHLHVRCLRAWQDTAGDGGVGERTHCQVCRQPFRMPPRSMLERAWVFARVGLRKALWRR